MLLIKELFKVGNGPSSSHTIGPLKASKEFVKRYPDCEFIEVILYGSLALTGKGHLTDYIIEKGLSPIQNKIKFDIMTEVPHPNTMKFVGHKGEETYEMTVYSVGGGAIRIEGDDPKTLKDYYPLKKFSDIVKFCKEYKYKLYEYVDYCEDDDFEEYLENIFNVMMASVDRGLQTTGLIPGKLEIRRKAHYLYHQRSKEKDASEIARRKIVAYAYAASEENASGGEIVTAPTCGAAGVLPACVRYAVDTGLYTHEEIINSLKVAGLIGNIVKHNASISGAEAGCQAEVGTACSMAATFLVSLKLTTYEEIESAAEIALEHHLGLTCDPIDGYVQIPCIERNAIASTKAIDAAKYALLTDGKHYISLDYAFSTMKETGLDLSFKYKETSKGGLAKKEGVN